MSVGLAFLFYGGFQIYKTNKLQEESLAEAKTIIERETTVDKANYESLFDAQKAAAEQFDPEHGETVGILHIPRLDAELPIIEGTHEDDLERGVGHYKGTAYPLQDDQIVLSGHRDTVFRGMGELEIGDTFIVEMPYGEFTYEIVEFKIVDAEDRTIIRPTAPDEVLTVTTCYPFHYVGNAPDRYIITALPKHMN